MYKLYVVDDEPHVIEGLESCIEWEKHGITIVGAATDGVSAYNEILDLVPDIVITDIKMPSMDGIALINKVHEQLPNVNFIIFSGYNDFHYAREAFLADAVDFLVKPSSTEEILNAVTLAVNKHFQHSQSNVIDYNSPNYRKLLKGIFMNPISEIYSEGYYYVIIINTLEVSTISILEKELNAVVGDRNLHASFINLFDSHLVIISSDVEVRDEEWGIITEKITENLNVYFTMDGDFIFLGISNPCKLHNLKAGYQEALRASEFCKWFTCPYCLYGQIDYSDISIHSLPFWDKLKSNIQKKNLAEIIRLLDAQFEEFQNAHISRSSLKEFCLKAYLTINNDMLGNYNINPILEISSLDSLKDSFIYLTTIFRNYFETLYTDFSGSHNGFIQKITLFIQAQYQNPISLNDVADYIGKSTGYVSNRFKKEFGVSFSQYVTDYRLLKARHLLITSNLKIKEIALMVGFADEQYFSQVFKKECGLTAGMYRKIYQLDPPVM